MFSVGIKYRIQFLKWLDFPNCIIWIKKCYIITRINFLVTPRFFGEVTHNNTNTKIGVTVLEWKLRDWLRGNNFKPENVTKAYYFSKISRLAINQFKWEVSELLNPEVIEKYLWLDGRVAIWKNPILGWVVTRCEEIGFDINGFANQWKPVFDKFNSDLPIPSVMGVDDDIVVIYDIPNRMFVSNICSFWVNEIADINETIKTQVFNQKAPLIVVAKNPREKDKLKNAIVDIANNVKALVLDTDIRQDAKALNIESPFNIADLQAYLKTKESEMLEYLGIDSQSSFQKKERLITDEQESNNQTLSYLIADRYESRLKGCEKLREKGLNISVSLTVTQNPNEPNDNEVVDNGTTETD